MRRRTCVLVGVALLAFTSACSMPSFLAVEGPPDGVTVKALTADIAFGEGATPVETVAAALAPGLFAVLDVLPELSDLAALQPMPRDTSAPRVACPKPSDTTFPEKSAGFLAEGLPPAGLFRWRQSGTIELVGLAKFSVSPLDTRRIRRLPDPAANTIAYEYEQVSLAGKEIQTIEVRQLGNAQTDGVYLTRFRLSAGDNQLEFSPPSALAPKLYSLPIRTEVVSATGVDAMRGLTLTINGNVDATSRVRLEGCGEVFDAWAFRGSRVLQSITEPDQAIRSPTYDTFLAPQHGAIFVGDHVVTRGSFGPFQYTTDIDAVLGNLVPLVPA
ncbi:MAG TPA: hypothetical protein VMY88_09845 [Acidimicrobiales bacterium]|nr:hypothetical protein [Acidimicrobiales bacterium]